MKIYNDTLKPAPSNKRGRSNKLVAILPILFTDRYFVTQLLGRRNFLEKFGNVDRGCNLIKQE